MAEWRTRNIVRFISEIKIENKIIANMGTLNYIKQLKFTLIRVTPTKQQLYRKSEHLATLDIGGNSKADTLGPVVLAVTVSAEDLALSLAQHGTIHPLIAELAGEA